MLRALVYILVSIFVISILRGMIGIITRGAADLLKPPSGSPPSPSTAQQQAGFTGELMKCGTCGTFSPPRSTLTASKRGQTVYFCSDACKQKYAA